jgi:hypothetical protein
VNGFYPKRAGGKAPKLPLLILYVVEVDCVGPCFERDPRKKTRAWKVQHASRDTPHSVDIYGLGGDVPVNRDRYRELRTLNGTDISGKMCGEYGSGRGGDGGAGAGCRLIFPLTFIHKTLMAQSKFPSAR